MSGTSRADCIRSFFTAYKTKDRSFVEGLLSDDFTFTSPYDDAIDKAAYFERCWPTSELIRSHELKRIMEEGDDAFVLYDCTMGDGKKFRNAEFFTFEGEKLRRVEVFFGASWRDGKFVRKTSD
ncbi:MAG: nuclear transport factor 2 family protein [Phyllobacterium sp.]